LAFDAPFVLDDDPTSDANCPMLFDNLSELLLAIGVREILDIDKCRELKRDIEAEIERDSDVESLISGL